MRRGGTDHAPGRFVARIRYDYRLVNIRTVLTHAEYDKGTWKE